MCFTVQLSRFVVSVSRTACLFYLILNCLSRTFLIFLKYLVFKKIKTEKEGFEPSRRVNDLLPFQGSPFGQLGYFSKLPYLLSSSDIYLCRSQRQVILYLVSFMLSSTFLTFLKSFYSVFDKRREWDSNPRALADKRFSRPPRYDHFDISPYNVFQHFLCCFVSACCILSSNISPVNNKFDIFFKKLDIQLQFLLYVHIYRDFHPVLLSILLSVFLQKCLRNHQIFRCCDLDIAIRTF